MSISRVLTPQKKQKAVLRKTDMKRCIRVNKVQNTAILTLANFGIGNWQKQTWLTAVD